MEKRIVCLDFDGVVNDYKGWHDEGPAVIVDRPVPGARAAIRALRRKYTVFIHSARCADPKGRQAIVDWLKRYRIEVDDVTVNKPTADYYLDDRAITFKGDWHRALRDIRHFHHYKFGHTRGYKGDDQ